MNRWRSDAVIFDPFGTLVAGMDAVMIRVPEEEAGVYRRRPEE